METFIKKSEDLEAVNDLHKKPEMHRSLVEIFHSGPAVFGWTYDQLGWPMTKGGFVAEAQ